jgi:hypothetical protein
MRGKALLVVFAGTAFVSCSSQNPVRPDPARSITAPSAPVSSAAPNVTASGKPGYEPAYVNGQTVTINAIEVPQNTGPLTHAAADFYQVVYPADHNLWPSPPQCNPCDHEGDGIDFVDFHDHVLDSMPSYPGHGEYNPQWHVFVVVPAPGHDAAYAARLPMKSEAAVDAAINAGDANEIDTHFYFICAVVSSNAAK